MQTETTATQDEIATVHCAYKAIPIANGFMFLFDQLDMEGLNAPPELNLFQGNLYLQYGRNVVLITPDVLSELAVAPFVVFARSASDSYQVSEVAMSYVMDPFFLARLQGALDVLGE